MADLTQYPRMLYRGPPDEHAETRKAFSEVEEVALRAEGWRRRRVLDEAPTFTADPAAHSLSWPATAIVDDAPATPKKRRK